MTRRNDDLIVRDLYPSDGRQILDLLRPLLLRAPYSSHMDEMMLLQQLFQPAPPTVHEMEWSGHRVLGAWSDERLFGFIDIGIGQDDPRQQGRSADPVGLLRFLAFPAERALARRTVLPLLEAAESYWRSERLKRSRGFSLPIGYPDFQAGAGLLPSAWEDHLGWLTDTGYRLVDRYYCLRRPLQRLVMEQVPRESLSLWPQRRGNEYLYEILLRDRRLAVARMQVRYVLEESLPSAQSGQVNPIAYLSDLAVAPPWQRRGIGRWLLRHLLNDALLLGCKQMVLHVGHAAGPALALFTQHGFEEINYRGYVLEKELE